MGSTSEAGTTLRKTVQTAKPSRCSDGHVEMAVPFPVDIKSVSSKYFCANITDTLIKLGVFTNICRKCLNYFKGGLV